MNRHIIAPLLLCCLASIARADDIALKENHPDRHVVVKGDTLWDISAKFLKDPWRWPQLWNMNRDQIRNPHLIYPGDVVVLDTSNGEARLKLLRETITLEPGTRIEPLQKQPIPTIAPSVIAPFLSQPLVIEPDGMASSPSIVGTQEERLIMAPGTKIYANNIEEGAKLNWQVFRPGKDLVDPDSKELLGVEAIYLGDAKLIRIGDPSTLEVIKAKEDIYKGDKLIQAPDKLLTSFTPRTPEGDIQGRIISALGGNAELGPNNIVAINRGSEDGLEEGHVLAIHSQGARSKVQTPKKRESVSEGPTAYFNLERDEDGQLARDEEGRIQVRVGNSADSGTSTTIQLPDERVGLVMIFRTFERVSYGLIMKAERPVHVLDKVQIP